VPPAPAPEPPQYANPGYSGGLPKDLPGVATLPYQVPESIANQAAQMKADAAKPTSALPRTEKIPSSSHDAPITTGRKASRFVSKQLWDDVRSYDDDDEESPVVSQKGSPNPLLFILPVVALILKGYCVMQVMPQASALPIFYWIDQAVTGIALVLCLILALGGAAKR